MGQAFRFLLISLIVVLITGISSVKGGELHEKGFFDRHGLTLMYGRSTWTKVGPDPVVHYEWTTIGYLLTKEVTPWFSMETQIGAGYLKAENGGDSPSAELRLLGDLHYKCLFLQLGCGVARIFDPDALPGLAETRAHSIISGTAGFRFPIGTGASSPMQLILGYGVEHISAISKDGSEGDTGWNAGGPRVGVTWQF